MATVPGPPRPDPAQGVFETLLIVDGQPVELDAHLARLEASLSALFPDHTAPDLRETSAVSRSEGGALSSLRVTVAPDGGGELRTRLAVREVERERLFDPPPVALGSLPLAGGLGAHKWADRRLLEAAQARLPGDALPLILDGDGAVLEASRANVFAVRDGALRTPPTDGRILPGVTRARVLEIATALGLEAQEAELSRSDLLDADEVFLTGSVRGVERAASLDGAVLSAAGEIAARLGAELRRAWAGAAQVG